MGARKVAIVTGSATGVGAATALALAAQGYDLLVNYSKSEAEAEDSAAACRNAGADTLLLRGDVADDASCREMVQAVVERWGRLDALVNNAGITTFSGAANWDAIDAETFQRVIGVNSLGTFQMIRACAGLITTRWFVDGIGAEGFEKLKSMYESNAPLGRASSAEDVADAVLWLVEGARTVTGELLLLDSGVHLGAAQSARIPGR
jgi:3-oxoacyl-[acyl-carrier protein] reductase